MAIFNYKKGSLILLSGVPGTGKSTFAKKFFPKEYIISTDEIRERYFGYEYKFQEDGELGTGNFESNGELIFQIVFSLAKERCKEGLTTVIDAMNLSDQDRKKFIDLGNWERIYIIIFDSENAIIQNKNRKLSRGYVPEKIIEKKILSFNKKTSLKGVGILNSSEIENCKETFDNLSLNEENNLLIFGDIHGIENFYENYKLLQEKYSKNGIPPMNLFVGDLVDRGNFSVDNLCFIISEVKKGNARMIMGNHDLKLLRNIDIFLEKGIIEDFVEARYKTIKSFVELYQNNGIYDGFIEEIKGENFSLQKVKNFLENLPFYKTISIDEKTKYLVTHAPILPTENLGNLKKSNCIFGSEQLIENLRISETEAEKNNINFLKAFEKLSQKNNLICVNGHVDFDEYLEELNISKFISLEGSVDLGGKMKVLILEKNGDEIIQKIEKFESNLNYKRGQEDLGEFSIFDKADKSLLSRKELGELTIFKYSKKVFHKNLWMKNLDEENKMLLKARGIVFDKMGKVISYPFDKIFNLGESLKDINGNIVNENKLPEGKYQFIEKLNGFLGIISQDIYSKNKLLIHTGGSLDSPFNNFILDLLSEEQKINIIKFFKQKGKHTLMFEVIHKNDPHIIKYSEKDFGLYLIGARNLQGENLDSMNILSEEDLDILGQELGFFRPKHFISSYNEVKKDLMQLKIEGYMVRDISTQKFLVKIKTPYYLITKFLGRMGEKHFNFLFANKEKFVESSNIDEEFYPIIEFIYEKKETFINLSEQEKMDMIRNFIEENL